MSEAAGVTILRPVREQLAPCVSRVAPGSGWSHIWRTPVSSSDFASLELFLAQDNCHKLLCECLRLAGS